MVAIERAAVGRTAGRARMMVNTDNPTVSTLSDPFVVAAKGGAAWAGQNWDEFIDVDVVTLDHLMEKYGVPSFIKLDVEGFEAEALAGLSKRVQSLSFEFTTIQRDVADACLERCVALGYRRFNAALGESQNLMADWIDACEITSWLQKLPDSANSGDVYCAV